MDGGLSGATTVAEAFARILDGRESPWTAVGDFLDSFYVADTPGRTALVATAPAPTADYATLRWAAFLAASTDWLSHRFGIECRDWVLRPEYILPEPWFLYPEGALRISSLFLTPPPFKARNIFCGDNALDRV
jgi:hypothetical protein